MGNVPQSNGLSVFLFEKSYTVTDTISSVQFSNTIENDNIELVSKTSLFGCRAHTFPTSYFMRFFPPFKSR